MARKSQHSFSKRQREQKKAEKAAQKRAKRDEPKAVVTDPFNLEAEKDETPSEIDEVTEPTDA